MRQSNVASYVIQAVPTSQLLLASPGVLTHVITTSIGDTVTGDCIVTDGNGGRVLFRNLGDLQSDGYPLDEPFFAGLYIVTRGAPPGAYVLLARQGLDDDA